MNIPEYCGNESGKDCGFYSSEEKTFYFYPQSIYSSVVEYYQKSNRKFPVNDTTLWRYLAEEGKLVRSESYVKQNRFIIQKRINGRNCRVVAIKERNELEVRTRKKTNIREAFEKNSAF